MLECVREFITSISLHVNNIVLLVVFALHRAKYIIGTVNALQVKPGGGEEWLRSLRKMDLEDVICALCTLPGVGPKVAACVALFSLDQHHAIPVDTHVWQVSSFPSAHHELLNRQALFLLFMFRCSLLDMVTACSMHVNLAHFCNMMGVLKCLMKKGNVFG